jgi:hypothetical protein
MTNNTNSMIVAALEQAWAEIRKFNPDVPAVVMVVASGSMGRKTLKWGHYAHNRWARKTKPSKVGDPPVTLMKIPDDKKIPEVLISGEGFLRGGKDVMGTLLHEAAHGLAAARGLKDTSRNGRYHNRTFKSLAEELGLEVQPQGSHGLASTSMPPATVEKWKTTIKALDKAIRKNFRFGEGSTGSKPGSRMLLAVCACGTKIRLSRASYEAAPITCGGCDMEFQVKK